MDGGYMLAGNVLSGDAGFNWWLVKTDAYGDSLWSEVYGTTIGHDFCHSAKQTIDGGYILAGSMKSGDHVDLCWLLKTDANGDSLWSRAYGGGAGNGEVCRDVVQTRDGGYVLGANTLTYGAGSWDFWLIKTDALGDSQWSRTFGGHNTDICYSVQQTADGGYIMGGLTYSFGNGHADFWLVKTGPDGDSLWSRAYGRNYDEICYSVCQTSDGGYVLAGEWSSLPSLDRNIWMLKADSDGDSLWSIDLGGSEDDGCYSVCQTADNGFILGGFTRSYGRGLVDAWLVKTGPELAANEPPVITPSSYTFRNFPNPFNAVTTIEFALPRSARVTIRAHNILGREVGILA
ncbi:MAG: hypothetical protein PHI18_10395, partial [bacterium]|nr:hypothetical protein [bacterium]